MSRIELNGVANLHLILQMSVEDYDDGSHGLSEETMSSIKKQLDYLERYMLAYSEATANGTKPPMWHEVLANPKAFPLNRDR